METHKTERPDIDPSERKNVQKKMKINRGSFNLFAFGFRLRLRLSVTHKLTKFQTCGTGNVRVRLKGTHHTFSGHF